MVHEVKNRLAELQLRLEARGDAQQELAIVAGSAQRLTALLLLQRETAGQLRAAIDAGQPADVLAELAAEYAPLFPQIRTRLDTDAAPELAFFDVFLLRRALANAVHNAYRYARSEVTLRALSEPGWTVFEIADDGPGFPDQLLQRDPSQPLAPHARGTGLGLYLANRVAVLHTLDGRCGDTQLLNRGGAVFRLLLP